LLRHSADERVYARPPRLSGIRNSDEQPTEIAFGLRIREAQALAVGCALNYSNISLEALKQVWKSH